MTAARQDMGADLEELLLWTIRPKPAAAEILPTGKHKNRPILNTVCLPVCHLMGETVAGLRFGWVAEIGDQSRNKAVAPNPYGQRHVLGSPDPKTDALGPQEIRLLAAYPDLCVFR